MLEGTHIPATWQDASNQCLFEVNTKDPRLNLGPVSLLSSFELENDLDLCLNPNLNCATSTNEFEMDFSLAINRLNGFVGPTTKLNILPTHMDLSKLLSFHTDPKSNLTGHSVANICNTVVIDQNNSGSYFIPELHQISEKIEHIFSSNDILEEPIKMHRNLGLLSGFSKNSCFGLQSMKSLFVDAKGKGNWPRAQEYINSRLLMDFFKVIMSEKLLYLPGTSSESSFSYTEDELSSSNSNESTSPISADLTDTSQSSTESSFIHENKIEEIQSEHFEPCCNSLTNEHVSDEADNDTEEEKLTEEHISIKEEGKELQEVFEIAIKPVKRLVPNKENVLLTYHKIDEANEIQKSGVQIFRKPTKLFVFDNLKEWKKRGEGKIEIWKLNQSDCEIYYMLLWDKSTEKLLIHMRLDRKWSIEYLGKCNNSCRWSHYNYANCPEGVRERLACRFRDSDVAAEFVSIVAKCVSNLRLH